MKKFKITLNNRAYEVEVEEILVEGQEAAPAPVAAPKAAPVAPKVAPAAPKAAPAPRRTAPAKPAAAATAGSGGR